MTESGNSLDIAFDRGLQLAFPPVTLKLLKALLQPSPSFSDIANYLQMDALLTAKVLHVVNTASYGFKEKITDLERAVIIIGTNELFKLVLALTLQKKLNPVHHRSPEVVFGDWRLTFWSALAAEAIAGRLCPLARKEAYIVGALKDLPLFLAFCQKDIPPFLRHERYATLPGEGQFADEMVNWGQSHPEMSKDIFEYWGFSEDMAQAVAVHHDYENVSAYPPLVQSVIYATRWSELLHAPEADMPGLFVFEMNMASELGLTSNEMMVFRGDCAERFNLLLEQLEIRQHDPALRLHDKSLGELQNHYFLALGTLGRSLPESPHALASILQKQLCLTWNIKDWDFSISLTGSEDKHLFRCRGDHGLITDISSRKVPPPQGDWLKIPMACQKRDFGTLFVPPYIQRQTEDQSSLPMYMSMLALLLEERYSEQAKRSKTASFGNLPFVMARLDKEGRIKEASDAFLDVFKLDAVPEGTSAADLLLRHLDLDLPPLEADTDDGRRSGFFISVPEGHFPGTPLYISRVSTPENRDESCLFIGDVTRMNSQQALAMAHQGLLGALFETLNEQVCLLDAEGRIVWTDESCRELMGRNIFNLSKPESSSLHGPSGSAGWNKSFLASLATSTKTQVMLALGGTLVPYTLIFSPLEGKADRQYLLMLHLSPPQASGPVKQEPQKMQAVRAKDSLTDLYGYSQFHMLLKYTIEQTRKQNCDAGIVFCDIEGLHKFNALHGCQKGDIMLRRVAGSLAENCRPGQDHACRYGSDKFAVVIHRASRDLLDSLASDIHNQVKERCGNELFLNIGLVLVSPEDTPKVRLDAARRASEIAASKAERTAWAD